MDLWPYLRTGIRLLTMAKIIRERKPVARSRQPTPYLCHCLITFEYQLCLHWITRIRIAKCIKMSLLTVGQEGNSQLMDSEHYDTPWYSLLYDGLWQCPRCKEQLNNPLKHQPAGSLLLYLAISLLAKCGRDVSSADPTGRSGRGRGWAAASWSPEEQRDWDEERASERRRFLVIFWGNFCNDEKIQWSFHTFPKVNSEKSTLPRWGLIQKMRANRSSSHSHGPMSINTHPNCVWSKLV